MVKVAKKYDCHLVEDACDAPGAEIRTDKDSYKVGDSKYSISCTFSFHAIKHIALNNDIQIIFPVHLNPNVQEPVKRILGKQSNVHLIPPQNYINFIYLLNKAYIILTDSGGVQEEAPSLGKPVLVLRDSTERIEGIHAYATCCDSHCPSVARK